MKNISEEAMRLIIEQYNDVIDWNNMEPLHYVLEYDEFQVFRDSGDFDSVEISIDPDDEWVWYDEKADGVIGGTVLKACEYIRDGWYLGEDCELAESIKNCNVDSEEVRQEALNWLSGNDRS